MREFLINLCTCDQLTTRDTKSIVEILYILYNIINIIQYYTLYNKDAIKYRVREFAKTIVSPVLA